MQTCAQCSRSFVLRFGALMDSSVVPPPPDPKAKELTLKAPGVALVSQAVLKPDAIGFGALDPIVGRFPIDEKGVRYAHLYSVALWREFSVSQSLVFFFVSLPLGLAMLAAMIASKGELGAILCSLPFLLLSVFHGYRVFHSKATRMRVIGFKDRNLDMTFIGGLGKRRKFVDEFFRRAGLQPVELP
ncbi:MAG: hypothetical protein DI536_15455 [Archangium gephyra]|uniref:Uncharacterized protein n=1 Tax=Archangium gephyra TaxID=48 RepID=A0A2W5USV9_9BACT|nr:MAG: hypothetical protein DI536_15455 [Archangium gephyra]